MLVCLGFALAGSAQAQSGPEPGCYTRTCSAGHLTKYPDLVVAAMTLKMYDQGNAGHAKMTVSFANQGHVRRDGFGAQVLKQFLPCYDELDGTPVCVVECNGGWLQVTRQDQTGLIFQTDYLMVGEMDKCGGAIDLAEFPDRLVKYRLNRVGPQMCVGM